MQSRDLAYWLQGLFELSDPKTLNERQTSLIKKHLSLVFLHEIDPSFGENREALQELHDAEPEARPALPLVSFKGDTTTLEQLFGTGPVAGDEAVKILSKYIENKFETAIREALKDPSTARPPRTGVPHGGGGFDRGGRRMMC